MSIDSTPAQFRSNVVTFPITPTAKHALPLGDDLQPTIQRLREIAAQAGDALLTEGVVHPDHALLDLCAETLHLRRRSVELRRQRELLPGRFGTPPATPAQNHLRAEIDAERDAADARAMQLTRRAAKLPAITPAGIYAKALVVRASRSAAAVLAMSLADELIACRSLRQSLWPALEGETVARPSDP
jgi:hypothetical protein